jgi:hypothetical protein
MKAILMILSSKFVMTPIILLALVHWFIYFTSAPGDSGNSLLLGLENGDWIERWILTAVVVALAALRVFAWDSDAETSETND